MRDREESRDRLSSSRRRKKRRFFFFQKHTEWFHARALSPWPPSTISPAGMLLLSFFRAQSISKRECTRRKGAKRAERVRQSKKKKASASMLLVLSFVFFSPVPRLGHVLLEALAQRVEASGRGEPAGAELEAEVLEGEGAHGRPRGGESVGVVHFSSFFLSSRESGRREREVGL